MEEWHGQIAAALKERNNPVRIGAVLGEVVSTSPWKVAIKDGKFMIDASNGYVCFQLIHHITTYSYRHSGKITHQGCHAGPKTDYDAQGEGKIVLNELWKTGDKVLVIPDENEQHFFIVDIVKEGV
jgi:hypothetical protein|nr:MAG TPA: Protein of unknown function (DUF2577) [Caudoviricetes sp.]